MKSKRRNYAPYGLVGVPRSDPHYFREWYRLNCSWRKPYLNKNARKNRAAKTRSDLKWQRKNRVRITLQQRMRSQIRRWEFFRRHGFRCAYCEKEFDEYTAMRVLQIDHKVSRKALGEFADQPGNTIAACSTCNQRKGAKSYTRFMAEMHPEREPEWLTE